jgi:hypothetical protein
MYQIPKRQVAQAHAARLGEDDRGAARKDAIRYRQIPRLMGDDGAANPKARDHDVV